MSKPILFGEWAPDTALYNQLAVLNAKNVTPARAAYHRLGSFLAQTDAVNARVRGNRTFRMRDGVVTTITGTADKLYKLAAGGSTWTDISDLAYTTDVANGIWNMAQFGSLAIMTNGADPPRQYNFVTAPATASVLGGSPPIGKFMMVLKDHLFLGNIDGAENRLAWSGFNDPEYWTFGQNLSDFQDFPEGGRITGLWSGEVGYCFQERMIREVVHAPGSPQIFDINPIDYYRGCAAYRSVIGTGRRVYFLGNDGFHKVENHVTVPIGFEKVDDWFMDNVNQAYITRTIAGCDIARKLVYFAFISQDNAAADLGLASCDRCLIYSDLLDRWAWADLDLDGFLDVQTPPTTLEDLDSYGSIESIPATLDAAQWNSDNFSSLFAVFNDEHRLGFLTGPNMPATLELKNIQLFPPKRQFIYAVRPITDVVDYTDVTVTLSAREYIGGAAVPDAAFPCEPQGVSPQDNSALMHDIKIETAPGADFNHIAGFYLDAMDDGEE